MKNVSVIQSLVKKTVAQKANSNFIVKQKDFTKWNLIYGKLETIVSEKTYLH